ncbi:CAAD domain-containing protein [Vulcanococcus sp.]|jgi:hypothetical protein|uniref:CAAD domain-containing protein n=1 Tax=Vulcanococcus sp. TaxID=2856995 RepID=UPI003C126364
MPDPKPELELQFKEEIPELSAEPAQIPVAEAAPLVAPTQSQPPAADAETPLPLSLLKALMEKLAAFQGSDRGDLLTTAKLLALALLAGILLKLAGGTLEAIDSVPLLGGLLELVGLVSALSFLSRNALKQQKRVELLSRIQRLKEQVLGR